MRNAALLVPVLTLALVMGPACNDEPTETNDDHIPIHDIRDQDGGPYGVVAVDNHFHDIHPEDDIEIKAARVFFVRNEGSNLHNFSIVGTDISKDLRPGDRFTLKPVGQRLEAGTYDVFCKYHDNVGMTGRFTVIE